jgi:hypothetical protein
MTLNLRCQCVRRLKLFLGFVFGGLGTSGGYGGGILGRGISGNKRFLPLFLFTCSKRWRPGVTRGRLASGRGCSGIWFRTKFPWSTRRVLIALGTRPEGGRLHDLLSFGKVQKLFRYRHGRNQINGNEVGGGKPIL